MSRLVCRGCGRGLPADTAAAYACPLAGHDGGDHVIGRTLDASRARFPLEGEGGPFLRYRGLTHAYEVALAGGMSDEAFVELVRGLDDAVKQVAGKGFTTTPFSVSRALSDAVGLPTPGEVWVKDETGNVSGSHKGRHLMGLAILGEVLVRVGRVSPEAAKTTRLAIASCGNAALAAAMVARAWNRPLDVFIPADANPRVVRELERLQASVHVCERVAGTPGDPCYHAFRAAVAAGGVPFCCQGPDNGLCIEGGETLAWEMVSELAAQRRSIDRLMVQVGGGALASACIEGWRDAVTLGAPVRMPRVHAVQTGGAFPLRRAWDRVVARIAPRLGLPAGQSDAALAEAIRARSADLAVKDELDYAAKHRAEFMWPWETTPSSVAHGILDDETYDWLAIVRGMIDSGGFPVVVTEDDLVRANSLGRTSTGIDVDETGSAGLAGLLALRAQGVVGANEAVAVIFSGVRR